MRYLEFKKFAGLDVNPSDYDKPLWEGGLANPDPYNTQDRNWTDYIPASGVVPAAWLGAAAPVVAPIAVSAVAGAFGNQFIRGIGSGYLKAKQQTADNTARESQISYNNWRAKTGRTPVTFKDPIEWRYNPTNDPNNSFTKWVNNGAPLVFKI